MAEQRAVTAVMLDHEQAYQKTSRWNRYRQAEPPGPLKRKPGPEPERGKQGGCDGNFEDAAGVAGLAIFAQNSQPITRRSRRRRMRCAQCHFLERGPAGVAQTRFLRYRTSFTWRNAFRSKQGTRETLRRPCPQTILRRRKWHRLVHGTLMLGTADFTEADANRFRWHVFPRRCGR
jgi:hypothetical protein